MDLTIINTIISAARDAADATEQVRAYCLAHGLPADEVLRQVDVSRAGEADEAIDRELAR